MPRYSQLVDHPGRLGALAPIFERREIAMAADENGQVVLVRPATAVVDVGPDRDDNRFGEVDEIVRRLFPNDDRPLVTKPGRGGIARVSIPNAELIDIAGERRWSVAPVQRLLAALRDRKLPSEPNHVVQGSQSVRGSPVGTAAQYAGGIMFTAEVIEMNGVSTLQSSVEPAIEPAWLRSPLALPEETYRPPSILVLDTGLRTLHGDGAAVEHPKLTCARVHTPWERDPKVGAIDDEDEYDDDATGTLDFEAGHGTFIAGIIQQICPDAEVHIGGALSSFGDGDVASVIATFEHALSFGGPYDIVVLSLGGYMSDDEAEILDTALQRLLGEGIGIAAAGNQCGARPYFPAALRDIVGVGALGQGGKAWFSNFGGWVDACAPGVDVVSTFFLENPTSVIGPEFKGWARWSGTSFSAPKVAAAVAQEMYLTRSTAKEAWRRLSDYQRYRFADLGIVFNL